MIKETEIERLERLIRDEKDTILKLSNKHKDNVNSLNRASRNLFKLQSQINELRSNS